jgi:hypothetical protein
MLSIDLSLSKYFHIHLTQSLLVLILGPVQLQLHLYPMFFIQYCSPLLLGLLHQILCQYNQPICAASYYSIGILYYL